MEDKQIIELYFERNEQAIRETENQYGSFCLRIAMNILSIREDAEECVNDTYYSVWKQIPPTVPVSFRAFLGRITRNLSISRFRAMRAKKRYSGMNVEQFMEAKQLSEYISDWLDSLSEEDCALFVRRYWFGDGVQLLAEKCSGTAPQMSARQVSQKLYKLRKRLKAALEEKVVAL